MMTEQEINAGNKLIALFMGWEANRFEHLPNKLHRFKDGKLIGMSIDQMENHSSFDWIMPVVHKLHSVISEHDQQFAGLVLFELGLTAEIETVFKAVVEATEYYNKLPKDVPNDKPSVATGDATSTNDDNKTY